jgi:hypothetical protein
MPAGARLQRRSVERAAEPGKAGPSLWAAPNKPVVEGQITFCDSLGEYDRRPAALEPLPGRRVNAVGDGGIGGVSERRWLLVNPYRTSTCSTSVTISARRPMTAGSTG